VKKPVAVFLLILLTSGIASTLLGMMASAFVVLVLIMGVFIGVAHYAHLKSPQPPPPVEPDLGTEHPIRIHKLVPDDRGPGFFDADG